MRRSRERALHPTGTAAANGRRRGQLIELLKGRYPNSNMADRNEDRVSGPDKPDLLGEIDSRPNALWDDGHLSHDLPRITGSKTKWQCHHYEAVRYCMGFHGQDPTIHEGRYHDHGYGHLVSYLKLRLARQPDMNGPTWGGVPKELAETA